MNDKETFKIAELSDSLGVDVDVTGEIAPVFDESNARRVIEAVLFAAGHPVTYAKLAEVLSTTVATVRGVVSRYAEEYNDVASPIERGVMLLTFDDSCQLASCEAYGDHVRAALGIKRGGNLSPSSLEVLAIIAYNEPVTRVYVDTVRGVDSGYAINSLTERQLIEPCGRLDAPGRPILYRTTKNFLRVFGLNSLTDLPSVKTAEPSHTDDTIPLEGMDDLAVAPQSADDGDEEALAPGGIDANGETANGDVGAVGAVGAVGGSGETADGPSPDESGVEADESFPGEDAADDFLPDDLGAGPDGTP